MRGAMTEDRRRPGDRTPRWCCSPAGRTARHAWPGRWHAIATSRRWGFAYGQRHAVELACRVPVRAGLAAMAGAASHWGGRLGGDHMVDMASGLAAVGSSALTSETAIAMTAEGLPNTFVPGRNLLFLTYAAAHRLATWVRRIVAGMCETDYSGYPDCRDDTIKAMQLALNLGMQRRFVLETPLMWRDKAATWALALALGGVALVELIREQTHSCYLGDRTQQHDWGYGCGTCPACELRAAGWERWRAQRFGDLDPAASEPRP